jgi:hypothetical protein
VLGIKPRAMSMLDKWLPLNYTFQPALCILKKNFETEVVYLINVLPKSNTVDINSEGEKFLFKLSVNLF